jgi:hypothetical protein
VDPVSDATAVDAPCDRCAAAGRACGCGDPRCVAASGETTCGGAEAEAVRWPVSVRSKELCVSLIRDETRERTNCATITAAPRARSPEGRVLDSALSGACVTYSSSGAAPTTHRLRTVQHRPPCTELHGSRGVKVAHQFACGAYDTLRVDFHTIRYDTIRYDLGPHRGSALRTPPSTPTLVGLSVTSLFHFKLGLREKRAYRYS